MSAVNLIGKALGTVALLASGLLITTSPASAATSSCAAYQYRSNGATLCGHGLPETGVDCKNVGYQVTLVSKSNDPWGLDGNDHDGFGCESYPLGAPATVTHSPKPSPSKTRAKPTHSATHKPSHSASASASHSATPALAVTGSSGGTFAAVGAGILALGGGALFLTRRRRTRFMS